MHATLRGIWFLALLTCSAAGQEPAAAPNAKPEAKPPALAIEDLGGKLRVTRHGALLTEYLYRGQPKPVLYPVIGPSGANVTRNWPLAEGEHEQKDHVHHRSLWFAHGSVNGHDFWTEGKGKGRIVHVAFDRVAVQDGVAIIRARNRWVASGGEVVCNDTRTLRFYDRPEGIVFDYDVVLHASEGPLLLGDTKEGTMAIRLAPSLRLRGEVARGHCVNSEGVRDRKAWGKRAHWVDYWGPLGGKTVGVAILSHPSNHAEPTWWHARDYGLFAANPFGAHDFEKAPAGTGDLRLAKGEDLPLRYRFYLHEGDAEQAGVAAMYREYAAGH